MNDSINLFINEHPIIFIVIGLVCSILLSLLMVYMIEFLPLGHEGGK